MYLQVLLGCERANSRLGNPIKLQYECITIVAIKLPIQINKNSYTELVTCSNENEASKQSKCSGIRKLNS